MSRGASFTVDGLSGFAGDLREFAQGTREGLARVSERTANDLRQTAQLFAPRDRGDLVRAIQVQGRGLSWRVGLEDAPVATRGGTNSAHLNPSVYGPWYEFGFVTKQIAAHPFMGPAVDGHQSAHADAVERVLSDQSGG